MDQGLETGVHWNYLDTRRQTSAASLQGVRLKFDYYQCFFLMLSSPFFIGDIVVIWHGVTKHFHDTCMAGLAHMVFSRYTSCSSAHGVGWCGFVFVLCSVSHTRFTTPFC